MLLLILNNKRRQVMRTLCFNREIYIGIRMGRQRVSKGKIIPKKDEKVIDVLRTLEPSTSDDEFVKKFREMYPDDWQRVVKRYDEHERLTPKGKSHPMAKPFQYMLNASRKIRGLYANGKDLNELLLEMSAPKPKFEEGAPDKLDKMLKKLADISSYETRVLAVNHLVIFKCEESISALTDVMRNDKVFEVRDTAYQRLVRFGCSVDKPIKGKAYTDPEIQDKFQNVASQLKPGFSLDKFESKFKHLYPEEYDLQRLEKRNRFKSWLKKAVGNLPKT